MALLGEEFNKLRAEIEAQDEAFHAALAKLEGIVTSLETKIQKGMDPQVVEHLKEAVQEARHDANRALE